MSREGRVAFRQAQGRQVARLRADATPRRPASSRLRVGTTPWQASGTGGLVAGLQADDAEDLLERGFADGCAVVGFGRASLSWVVARLVPGGHCFTIRN